MSQHDYNIADQSGSSFLTDINNALAAIVSLNSGATEPATMFAYQPWVDTTTGKLKVRNAANSAWIEIGTIATTNLGLALVAGVSTQTFSVADATAIAHAVRADQIQKQSLTAYTTAGTSTAYTITTLGTPIALTTGECWRIKFNQTAGAAPTLNRDSKGAKALKLYDSTGAKVAASATTIIANMLTYVEYDGTDYVILDSLPAAAVNDILLYQDQKTSGTAGGTYAPSGWRTVVLNTEVIDTAGIGSISANQISLAAGSYEFRAAVTVGDQTSTTDAALRLQNITDATTTIRGPNFMPNVGVDTTGHIFGSFTIATAKTFEVQIYPGSSSTTAACAAATTGDVEVYASAYFRRYSV